MGLPNMPLEPVGGADDFGAGRVKEWQAPSFKNKSMWITENGEKWNEFTYYSTLLHL